ncbi:uncharacterized protein TNCV_2502911 [Trichonephila clavipes]|nr:uncharacterized protein TNCV_2502911 [Trichonephila clavipes]
MGSILLPHKFFSRAVILFNRTPKYLSCSNYRNASSCSKITCSPLFINHHLLRKNSPSLISSRTFWETFPSVRPLFHVKDCLDPENHDLIYRGPERLVFLGLGSADLALLWVFLQSLELSYQRQG